MADTKKDAAGARGDADRSVREHIESLVTEEHRLYGQDGLSEADRGRLHAVQVELDQYWDLLRQRRARREFGDNPGGAHVRPAKTVENYEG
jgi:hypothetical protein